MEIVHLDRNVRSEVLLSSISVSTVDQVASVTAVRESFASQLYLRQALGASRIQKTRGLSDGSCAVSRDGTS